MIRLYLIVVFNVLFALSASATAVATAESIRPGPAVSGGTSDGFGGLYAIGGVFPYYESFVGQIFTASKSGILHSASFIVINHSINPTGDNITVSIAPLIGGKVRRILDSSSILYSTVPRETALSPYQKDYNITAFFGGKVKIIAGQKYALTISSLGDLGSHYRIWMPNDSNPYKFGQMFGNEVSGVVRNKFQDLFFRVKVNRFERHFGHPFV